jgi:hypothetical protein
MIIGLLTLAGYRCVAKDGCIFSDEHNTESVAASILVAFQRSGRLLDQWQSVAAKMYPNRHNLLQQILTSDDLSLTKLAKGFTMTDTCNTARKIQQLLHVKIDKICTDNGLSEEGIELHTSYAGSTYVLYGSVRLNLH